MKKILFLFGWLLWSAMLFANGDPVIEHSSMTLSKTPVSRHIPEIQITYERMDIKPMDQYTQITVLYRLQNLSRRKFRNIHYGFPIDWYGTSDTLDYSGRDNWTESQREVGWRKDYVTDVSFELKGKQLPWKCSEDTILHEAGSWQELMLSFDSTNHYGAYQDFIESEDFDSYDFGNRLNRRWYYTTFSINPKSTVELKVSYTLANSYISSIYDACCVIKDAIHTYSGTYPCGKDHQSVRVNTFAYDFSPASAWGNGKADSLEVYIDMQSVEHRSWHDEQWNYIHGIHPDTLSDGNLVYRTGHFDYAQAEPLQMGFMTRYTVEEDLAYLFEHRLSEKAYTITMHPMSVDSAVFWPLSDMDFSTAAQLPYRQEGTEILIHFHEPQNVTGLIILNGWCKDSSAWVNSSKIDSMMVWKKTVQKNAWGYDTFLEYGKTVRENNFSFHYDYYPAACRLSVPKQFTWKGVIAEAEKMNINHLLEWLPLNADGLIEEFFVEQERNNRITDLRIVVHSYQASFTLSEIMVLTAPLNTSVFGSYTYIIDR